MKTIFKLAWRNIWRNKRRTLITIASVFFAVILSVLISSMKEGLFTNMIKTSVEDFTGYVQLQNKDYFDEKILDNSFVLDQNLEKQLQAESNIKAYLPRIESFALAATDKQTKGTMVVGIDLAKENLYHQLAERVVEGKYIQNATEKGIMLGDGLAKRLKLSINDTLILLGAGYHGSTAAGKYPVKAILKFGSPDLSKQIVFLPLAQAENLFSLEKQYTAINLVLKNNQKFKETAQALNKILPKETKAYHWEELMPEMKTMIDSERSEGYIFMFILYMVVSFGMFGTSLMMLSERRKEFGVMISIGMKKMKLALSVWIEIILLSLWGAFLGMLAAFPICYYFHKNPIPLSADMKESIEDYGIEAVLQFSIRQDVFLTQATIVFVLASIISIYSFIKILNYNPIKAMRA